ncbi:MAG: aliphatic sulfonate ABC transporter substrate-binding protein, partial [Lachnospiraceae bacterium]|nr:aliphatic sulfonate ABC transporter substrate-binding protein [Lachnospiraceae bacterium]
AVLWEPTLSTTLKSAGTVLYSTESEPGLIPDTLAVRSEVIKNSPDAVQAIVNSWFDGVKKLNAGDKDFLQAICDGAELEMDDYLQIVKGVTIFDKKKNQETFKEGKDFTSLKYCLDQSADFLLSTKMIDKLPDDTSVILDDSFIK